MDYIKRNKFILVGSVVGGILGYIYYVKIGCSTGTCMITSSPINSTLYGLLMGGLFVSMFQPKTTKK